MPAAVKQPKVLTGVTMKQAMKTPILYVFLLSVFAMTFATGAALQLPAYLVDIGYSSATAAKAASAYMIVGILGKLLLGQVVDKFGEKIATVYICGVGVLSFVFFIFAKNPAALVIMVIAYGLGSGITSVMPALLTSKIFGNRDYGPIYGVVMSINRFGGVIGTVLVSALFDLTKSYAIIWPTCVVAMALTMFAILYCMAESKKRFTELEPAATEQK